MTKANGDLQVVILVGPGDRLYPLVDEATVNNAAVSTCSNITINNSASGGNVALNSSMTGSSSNPNLNTCASSAVTRLVAAIILKQCYRCVIVRWFIIRWRG